MYLAIYMAWLISRDSLMMIWLHVNRSRRVHDDYEHELGVDVFYECKRFVTCGDVLSE